MCGCSGPCVCVAMCEDVELAKQKIYEWAAEYFRKKADGKPPAHNKQKRRMTRINATMVLSPVCRSEQRVEELITCCLCLRDVCRATDMNV